MGQSISNTTQEAIVKETNKLKLVVDNTASAGKEPPEGDNWLARLETGTVFLCKEKNSANFILAQFALLEKIEDSSRLLSYIQPVDVHGLFVDNNRFCNRFTYVDTLGIINSDSEEKEVDKG